MATLVELDILKNSGLSGLTQYLAWALTETRRLAILDGQQRLVRLASELVTINESDTTLYQGRLKAEVNLKYNSISALAGGLNFLPAVLDQISGASEIPTYICSSQTSDYMAGKLEELKNADPPIATIEQFLFWCCLSYVLSVPQGSSLAKFTFLEENQDGAIAKFDLAIPFDYEKAIADNIVCHVIEENLILNFPNAQVNTDSTNGTDNSSNQDTSNDSSFGNDSNLGN